MVPQIRDVMSSLTAVLPQKRFSQKPTKTKKPQSLAQKFPSKKLKLPTKIPKNIQKSQF